MLKVFYKGEEIDVRDLTFSWSDHWGKPKFGDLTDFVISRVEDAVDEAESGDGF